MKGLGLRIQGLRLSVQGLGFRAIPKIADKHMENYVDKNEVETGPA